MDSQDSPDEISLDPRIVRWVFLGLVGLVIAGGLVVALARRKPTPPPVDIASDAFLIKGREVYLDRCVSCHGPEGRGDGPVAKIIQGAPVRNFVEDPWKHGEAPEKVYDVIANGVQGTQMPGWKSSYRPEELRAVAGFVYYLGKKPVPAALRTP